MRPQRKRMMVETTRAFVKLKQNKAVVSAGGTNFGNFNPAQHPSFGRWPQIQVERIGVGG